VYHLLFSLPESWDNNETTLSFDDVVSSVLLEEMRWKNMEIQNKYALFKRGFSQERNKNKFSRGRSKYRGRYKYPRKFIKVCWRCGKEGNYNKQCRSKNVERGKGSNDAPSTEEKTSADEGVDVYLDS
jgi:hypothetical protein